VKLEIRLGGKHHAGEGPRDQHDGLGFDANEINLVNQIAPRSLEGQAGRHGIARHLGQPPQPRQPVADPSFAKKIHVEAEAITAAEILPVPGVREERALFSTLADLIEYGRILDLLIPGQQQHFAHHFGRSGIVIGKGQKDPPAVLAVNCHNK